ncbi:carbohydrate ABC transporter substrate-binding protein, CUT1 family (TC 3.A.1.1.-) [Amphibacillus marinus]|uniref:Carbohydrate ABC transporter substrate-binding protein, CUT1 family (TC 3.A.1.1.-) n=1 Tax=Amphibacillus marinus TaxID=872970 RepID=A0A1H8H4W5_9BACI|nr:extracellular solute-binding protein [Amphibacillus marinus]SEN51014.1 carbohydrate ABC transporter substrate-binding protein, CUT1 family (TC 3.A.1.1.-) [Amphibacillus marinus]
MKKYVLLILVSLFLLTACNGGDSENGNADNGGQAGETTIRVAWWGNQERHDMTLEAIELFNDIYPDINVQPEYTGWDGYWERLNTQAAGSNLPDVIAMDNSYLNEYNSNELLIDLAPLIDDGTINLSDVDDVYQEINHDGDRVLAVASGANALSLVYNTEMLEEYGYNLEPGYTYDDLYEMNLAIKEAIEEDGGEFFGYDFANAEYELFNNYARQNGMTLYNEAGDGLGFAEETLVEYFNWVHQMVADEAAPPHDIMMSYIEGGNSMLQEGTAVTQTAASNQLIGLSQGTQFELDLTILPALDGVHANYIRPSMSFAITNHSAEQEAAAKFIDFITNNLEANEILQAERGVPISQAVRDHLVEIVSEPVQKTFAFLEVVAEYTQDSDPLSPPGETEVRGAFIRIVESLKYGQVTPEEAASQFIQQAENVLN